MVNQQLLDYIKQNLEGGISRENIKKSLISAGWREDDIDEGFQGVSLDVPQASSAPTATTNNIAALPGAFELAENAWRIYKQRLWTFWGIMIAPILSMFMFGGLMIILGATGGFLGFFIRGAVTGISIIIFYIIFIIIAFIASMVAQSWSYVALLYAIKDSDENIGIIESFRRGWHKIISYWWISVLTVLITIGGLFLGIIPGIIFAVWFGLASIILITEDIKGLNALLKSKEYVKGYWWNIAWRVSVLIIVIAGFYLIIYIPAIFVNRFLGVPFIDTIGNYVAQLFAMPFGTIYGFHIYKNLRAIKGEFVFEPKKRGVFIALAVWGIAALLIIPILATIIAVNLSSAA